MSFYLDYEENMNLDDMWFLLSLNLNPFPQSVHLWYLFFSNYWLCRRNPTVWLLIENHFQLAFCLVENFQKKSYGERVTICLTVQHACVQMYFSGTLKRRNIAMNNKYFLLYVTESAIYTYVCQNVNVHVASSKSDIYILMIVKIQFYKKAEI